MEFVERESEIFEEDYNLVTTTYKHVSIDDETYYYDPIHWELG